MRVILNPKSLIPDRNWQFYRKVRAVIENETGEVVITERAGKYIFPGGKCDENEKELDAIKREIKEETGINFKTSDFNKILELETIYDNFFDHRTGLVKPRHTITTYYYVKTNDNINQKNMYLSEDEIKDDFKCSFVEKKALIKMLMMDHSKLQNGKFFDEENKVIIETILKRN